MSGIRTRGWEVNNLTTYSSGYVLGTNGEAPYSYLLLTSNVVFGGFISSYPVGSFGLLVFVQDVTGGRDVDWDNRINFIGSSGINLAANAPTVVEVVKTTSGWIGHKW